MTTRSWLSKLAAIVAALIVVFLPEEAFSILWEEGVWFCIIGNTVVAITGWEFVKVYVEFFSSFLERIARFFIAYQIIGLGEKGFSIAMLFLILNHKVIDVVLFVTPIYFFYCIFIVRAYDFFLEKGYDLLELENLRVGSSKSNNSNKLLRWILRRKNTIFLVGSCFQLDPDGVTILLRENKKKFWKNSFKITLPSVLLSMTFWTAVYVSAIRGYEWAKWLIE